MSFSIWVAQEYCLLSRNESPYDHDRLVNPFFSFSKIIMFLNELGTIQHEIVTVTLIIQQCNLYWSNNDCVRTMKNGELFISWNKPILIACSVCGVNSGKLQNCLNEVRSKNYSTKLEKIYFFGIRAMNLTRRFLSLLNICYFSYNSLSCFILILLRQTISLHCYWLPLSLYYSIVVNFLNVSSLTSFFLFHAGRIFQ